MRRLAALLMAFAAPVWADEASLDERIAELEASAAMHRPDQMSLKVSGQVNRAVLLWDDGLATDAYLVDNIFSSSRFIFSGKAAVGKRVETGFVIEKEVRDAGSSNVSQTNDEGLDEANETGQSIRTRQAYWWVKSEDWGAVSVGQLSPATNSLIYYKLWFITVNTSPDTLATTSFFVRNKGGALTGLRWGQIASASDTPRGDYVRYESPAWRGFAVQADWGENDLWDASATYDGQLGDFKISAAIGYVADQEVANAASARGSLLVTHIPSGVYLHLGADRRSYEAQAREDATVVYGHLGLLAKWTPLGTTTVFAEYGRYTDFFAGRDAASAAGLPVIGASAAGDYIESTDVTRLGFGVMQAFDAAATELYAHYSYFEAEARIADGSGAADAKLEPWQSVLLGARVKF
jgi:predicted porin